jgi:hypothetical protein
MEIKSIAAFWRALAPGVRVHTIMHQFRQAVLTEDDRIIYHIVEKDMGIREVSIVQTNSFACKTWQESKGQFTDSWLWKPKASEAHFPGGTTMEIYENKRLTLTYKIITDEK